MKASVSNRNERARLHLTDIATMLYTNLKCIWHHVFILEIFISERKKKKFQNHNLLQIINSFLSIRNVDQFLLFSFSYCLYSKF